MVTIRDIDEKNWGVDLKVSPSQKHHVAGDAVIMARAYAYRNLRSRAFIVYDGTLPVGMGLYYDNPECSCYDISQFFIDERYQHRGYGRKAMQVVLDTLKQERKFSRVELGCMEDNPVGRKFYAQLGFEEIECICGEITMRLELE